LIIASILARLVALLRIRELTPKLGFLLIELHRGRRQALLLGVGDRFLHRTLSGRFLGAAGWSREGEADGKGTSSIKLRTPVKIVPTHHIGFQVSG